MVYNKLDYEVFSFCVPRDNKTSNERRCIFLLSMVILLMYCVNSTWVKVSTILQFLHEKMLTTVNT